jgi:inhibitor of KinA sporulation pathway (predicted exonuclease)
VAIRKDKIVVVDIEATCWDGDPPPGQVNEIIEIGICLLDVATRDLTHKRSLIVRPEFSSLSPFCAELTQLTPDQLHNGLEFAKACWILEREYDTRNRLWASWGAYDRQLFVSQCNARKVRYPFSKKHANIKRVFADAEGNRIAMLPAMAAIGLEPEGAHHRGDDDAWNTARLLNGLLERHGLPILQRYW